MSQPYSHDLRVRVLHALETSSGRKRSEIAQQFEICEATLYNWQRQKKREGCTTPKPHAGGNVSHFDVQTLRDLLDEKNDRTLEELVEGYQQRTGTSISKSTVDRLLKRAGITRKKNKPRAAEQLRAEVAEQRAAFRKTVARLRVEDLVFVDESAISTAMSRRYARAPQRERAVGRCRRGTGNSSRSWVGFPGRG